MAHIAAEPYQPAPDETYMNPRQTDYFRRRLLAWQSELLRQLNVPLAGISQEKARLPDPIDQGVQEVDLQQDLEQLQRTRRLLREIEAALGRIEDGSYGYCLESGEKIGLRRLIALPVAALSVEMQEERELRKRQRQNTFAAQGRKNR